MGAERLLGIKAAATLMCVMAPQAGDKVKALKCLIRSGDTDKIVFFAGVSRTAEIYTLAANYLQTLDWHSKPDLAQSIVTFYSKVSFEPQALSCLRYSMLTCATCCLHSLQMWSKSVKLSVLSQTECCCM